MGDFGINGEIPPEETAGDIVYRLSNLAMGGPRAEHHFGHEDSNLMAGLQQGNPEMIEMEGYGRR